MYFFSCVIFFFIFCFFFDFSASIILALVFRLYQGYLGLLMFRGVCQEDRLVLT